MLPLDLHVLGLSLAFILSQDQTLRCIIFFFFFSLYNLLARDGDLFLVSYYFFLSIVIPSRIACFFHSKTDCKSKGFILILQKKSLFFPLLPLSPEKRVQK